jgi:hypothetical protein
MFIWGKLPQRFSNFSNIEDYVLALLPSYLEREGSSLIYMVDLIELSNHPESGFTSTITTNWLLTYLQNKRVKTLFWLSYLCFIGFDRETAISITTYHHHGNRWYEGTKEMIRENYTSNFVKVLAQPYILNMHDRITFAGLFFRNGVFECPAWMQILVRDTEDALTYSRWKNRRNQRDWFANINSCSFIATQDLGKKNPNNSFEVLGRLIIQIFEVVIWWFLIFNNCEHAYFIFKLFYYSLVYVAMRKTPI